MTDVNRDLADFLRGADECLPHHDATPEPDAAAVPCADRKPAEDATGWDANGSPVE